MLDLFLFCVWIVLTKFYDLSEFENDRFLKLFIWIYLTFILLFDHDLDWEIPIGEFLCFLEIY